MSTRSILRHALFTLALVMPACDEESAPEPTRSVDADGAVTVEIDGFVVTSEETSDGLVSVVRDSDTHEDLALFQWDEVSNAAVLELFVEQESRDVHLEAGGEPPTLDTVHGFALAAYQPVGDAFRWQYIDLCCWWGDFSQCGYAGDPESGGTVCCGWCITE